MLTRPSLKLYDSWADCVAEFGPGQVEASAMWLVNSEPDVSREYCAALVAAIKVNADTTLEAPEGLVHADAFWVMTEDQKVIGFLQLRHTLNDYLRAVGGHIGYSIRPSHRRRGHATRALGLALDRARDLGLYRVLMTCDDDNVASIKTIENSGGLLEDVREGRRRYWITL